MSQDPYLPTQPGTMLEFSVAAPARTWRTWIRHTVRHRLRGRRAWCAWCPAPGPLRYLPPVQLPRLGAHLSMWGTGHSCDLAGAPHDGPCVCECGVTQPYDSSGPQAATHRPCITAPNATGAQCACTFACANYWLRANGFKAEEQ